MIEYLRIAGIGVINDAELELHPGLTVLTGETGAGKTLVLTALDLLIGGKAETSLVSGDVASVEGAWRVGDNHPAATRVAQAGGVIDDGLLVISRSVPANGRGRCFAGGRTVPQTLLSEIGPELVAVHGQSDQSLLKRESSQRALLDQYAGDALGALLQRYRVKYRIVRDLDQEVAVAMAGQSERAREMTETRAALERIAHVAPAPGEDIELAARARRLTKADALTHATEIALAAIASDDYDGSDITRLLALALRSVESVASDDAALAAIGERLSEVMVLIQDVAGDLSRYLADCECEPGELDRVNERRGELSALVRLYGSSVADVIIWSSNAAARMLELERACDIDRLATQRREARADLAALAEQISTLRSSAAARLSAQVTTEINQLAMPDALLVVSVAQRATDPSVAGLALEARSDPVGFGPDGIDEIEFLLVAHRGADPAPLARAASGGELSRVMLGLEVVLAGISPVSTFVFDEVDAGVGGKAAVEVGRRLARLGKGAQVLVVTHLPQVAAFADHHLVVTKHRDDRVTASDVIEVKGTDRVRELARMLAGQDESTHAAAHAGELLDLAALERRSKPLATTATDR